MATQAIIVFGRAGGRSVEALAARRDAALIAILGARIEVAGEAPNRS